MFIYHFNRLVHKRILWAIFAVIIAVAFVSVDSCFKTPQGAQVAGTIDGKPVTIEMREVVVTAIRGFGRNRDNNTSANVVEHRVWEQIAAVHTAKKNGFVSTEAEIQDALKEMPAFQGANGFDMMQYRQALLGQGMVPSRFELLVGHQLNMLKVAAMVETASWISPLEMNDELAAMTDKFTVQVAVASNRFDKVEMRLTDADYKKYYDGNKESMGLPERVSVRYITIPVSNYLASVTVPEEDLQGYYDSHMDTYRRTSTNNVSETIPYAEVREKILAILKMVEARYCAETNVTFNFSDRITQLGTNALAIFAAERKQQIKFSPLFGLTETLYWTDSSSDFATAAFELDSEQLDTRFGIVKGQSEIYLMELKQRSPAHIPAFENVLTDVKARAQEKARAEAYESYTKELRADIRKLMLSGKTFSVAAKEKGLSVTTNMTYAVNEMQNQPGFDNGFAIAYGARDLKKGEISEAVPASPVQSLIIYVQDRKPGDMLAAEMMRSQIRMSIARRRGNSLFTDWLKWNQVQVKAKPTVALEDDENMPAQMTDEKKNEPQARKKK
ncbi:MAG: SurA N-terminal domain-containing protein [bacterium]